MNKYKMNQYMYLIILLFFISDCTSTPKITKIKEYYDNGKLKVEGELLNGKQEGLFNFYYDNGQLFKQAFFKEGINQDTLKIYYNDGSIKEISYIKNDKKNGFYKEYYKSGAIKYIGSLKEDFQEGYWLSFNLNSNSLSADVAYYKQGKLLYNNKGKTHFKNEKYSFSFPNSWQLSKAKTKGKIVLVDNIDNNGDNIVLIEHGKGSSLSLLVNKELSVLRKAYSKIDVLSVSYFVKSGREVCEILIYGEYLGENFYQKIYFFKHVNEYLSIILTTFPTSFLLKEPILYYIFNNIFDKQ